MEQFMLKVTIPHYEKNDKGRLWDAIWRAHRDVMTGARTGKLKNYSRQTKDKGLENPAVNALYDIVIQCKNEALTSEKLIANLKSQLESDTEFGAIQKLVNASKEIESGKLGVTINGEEMPNKEFKYLQNSFNNMSKTEGSERQEKTSESR